MLRTTNPSLLPPPIDEPSAQAYAGVWPRLTASVIIIGAVTIALQAIHFLSPALLSATYAQAATFFLSVLPILSWGLLSWRQERRTLQPRTQLLSIGFAAFLSTYTLILPVIERVFTVGQWLPLASALDRILGYTFTTGIPQAGLIYGIVMLLVWRSHLQYRQDILAYCITASVAYACAENLYFLSQSSPLLDAAAIRFFSNFATSIASGLTIAYGLIQTRFDEASSIVMPFTLFLSSVLIGAFTPLHAGLISATLSLEPGSSRPLFGLGLAFVVLIVSMNITNWLLASAENRAREAESIDRLDVLP